MDKLLEVWQAHRDPEMLPAGVAEGEWAPHEVLDVRMAEGWRYDLK